MTRTVDLAPDVGGFSRGIALAGAIMLLAAGVIGVAWDWTQNTQEGIAGYKAWVVAGPPCAAPSNSMLTAAARTLQVSSFGRTRFARQHGAMQCSDVATAHGWGFGQFQVCQFDHPGLVEVSTRRGVYRFWAGYVSPATISVEHDLATCVIGANQDFGHRLVYDALPARGP